jgi:2-(1,2-epoxy-1,2-dihydrophenyl)acetyl-CoA isomerase
VADVLLEQPEPGLALLTLNRPEVRNAAGNAMWRDLRAACEELAATRPRAVVLTGAGGAFSAGGDLKEPGPVDPGVMGMSVRLGDAHRALLGLRSLRAPVVAAVAGPAVGVGWGLALGCDVIVAEEDAFFAAPFVQRGLVPDGGVAWHLTRTLGAHRAFDLLTSGRRLPAGEAEQLGLVTAVVPTGESLPAALERARALAASSADALALTRRMVRLAGTQDLPAFLDDELHTVALNGHGPDPAEGRRAFVEKRPPEYWNPAAATEEPPA